MYKEQFQCKNRYESVLVLTLWLKEQGKVKLFTSTCLCELERNRTHMIIFHFINSRRGGPSSQVRMSSRLFARENFGLYSI